MAGENYDSQIRIAKRVFLAFLALFLIFLVILIQLIMIDYWPVRRDVDEFICRAQVAADAEDMLFYMRQAKTGMEKWDLTHGHTAFIFKAPNNDLSLTYRAVQRIIERLEEIVKNLPRDSVEDVRMMVKGLPRLAWNYMWVRNGPVIIGVWFLFLAMVTSGQVWSSFCGRSRG